ncbi:PREDICTED: phospholipase A-2-activating protein [Rhagoletis zephyria]|uniref:phospholipase A-2-activating protein n=1 Tax=Rhagoletis zephyria TaxID=28612 RepID=UPI0008113C17|nr:PREDICTED: phospholipase A-2-activating protein [Rhagoletis zephyria]
MATTLNEYKLSCELLGHSMDVRSVAAGEDTTEGQVIISGSRDKTVKLWKRMGEAYAESVTFQDHKNFVACVCYIEAEKWICTGSNDATVAIYKEAGFVPILTLKGHESTVCSIAGGAESQTLITGSWDSTARIWTIDQNGGVTSVVLRGHEAAVWSVACLAEVKKYITGAADKCIYYWNAKGEKLRMLKGHTDCVRGILTLNNNSLVSCANDALIKYWNEDGECVQELSGHTNYIYSLAANRALGKNVIVSCGEDSTLRMWDLQNGQELGDAILHPAQSVWSVACLNNGDIVTGSSDGVVRVFTKDPARYANELTMKGFLHAVETRKAQMSDEIGGVKKTDLPGPEALLTNGTREGQTKMVRHPDGSVKCYTWGLGEWTLVGDVTGATGGTQATSGKALYEGKEYDYVFSVDISDTEPPIKLPYNRGEDPWQAAQAFIHRNNLPQAYLDQVANFIVKNSSGASNMSTQPTTSGYQDPFTGGSRYVPGGGNQNYNSTGNVDPFTGGSSYSTTNSHSKPEVNFIKGSERHFPVRKYLTFDNCDSAKVLDKLKEFNNKLTNESEKVSEILLNAVIALTAPTPEVDTNSIEALQHLLRWPNDILFPVLDVSRLAIRHEPIFSILNSYNFLDTILPNFKSSAANTLMIVRCLANIMCHETGRRQVQPRLETITGHINEIKSGSANLQIAIATFYLNVTISQTLSVASSECCRVVTEGIVELLKWATDLEACYRAFQAIGNLTTTPFGQETVAIVVSVDYVIDKIRELTNTPQAGVYAKLNSVGSALLATF